MDKVESRWRVSAAIYPYAIALVAGAAAEEVFGGPAVGLGGAGEGEELLGQRAFCQRGVGDGLG